MPVFTPQHGALYVPATVLVLGPGLDPGETTSNIALSGPNDTIATVSTSVVPELSRGIPFHDAGTHYFEVTFTNVVGAQIGAGLAQSTFTIGGTLLGGTADSICIYSAAGDVFTNNAVLIGLGAGIADGDIIGVAVNTTTSLIWLRINNGFWNASSGADPTDPADPDGITIPAGTWYPALDFQPGSTGSILTVNFGPIFAFAKPSGYSDWYDVAPAGVTWDAISAGITLSGTDTVATCSGAGGSTQARSSTSKSSGKWYAKFAFHYAGGTNAGIAVVGSTYTLGALYAGGDANSACAYTDGVTSCIIYHNNTPQGAWSDLGAGDGAVVELALDLDSTPRKVYWRNLGADDWNADGTINIPETSTGGQSIASLDTDVYFICDFEAGETGSSWTIVPGTPPTGYSNW